MVNCGFFSENMQKKRKQLADYDIFVNQFLSNLSAGQQMCSPLANMALATKAWKEKMKKPVSQRVLSRQDKEKEELILIGVPEDYAEKEKIDLALPTALDFPQKPAVGLNLSMLENIFPQLPAPTLEKHLNDANGELDQAIDFLLDNQSQELATCTANTSACRSVAMCSQVPVSTCTDTSFIKPAPSPPNAQTNSNLQLLVQMFPQFHCEGILHTLKSCNDNLYAAVDMLLKLVPEESKQVSVPMPSVISFSKTVTSAVGNVPDTPLDPFSLTLSAGARCNTPGRKAVFCKRCGHELPPNFMGTLCPNPFCCHPLPTNLRM